MEKKYYLVHFYYEGIPFRSIVYGRDYDKVLSYVYGKLGINCCIEPIKDDKLEENLRMLNVINIDD